MNHDTRERELTNFRSANAIHNGNNSNNIIIILIIHTRREQTSNRQTGCGRRARHRLYSGEPCTRVCCVCAAVCIVWCVDGVVRPAWRLQRRWRFPRNFICGGSPHHPTTTERLLPDGSLFTTPRKLQSADSRRRRTVYYFPFPTLAPVATLRPRQHRPPRTYNNISFSLGGARGSVINSKQNKKTDKKRQNRRRRPVHNVNPIVTSCRRPVSSLLPPTCVSS